MKNIFFSAVFLNLFSANINLLNFLSVLSVAINSIR